MFTALAPAASVCVVCEYYILSAGSSSDARSVQANPASLRRRMKSTTASGRMDVNDTLIRAAGLEIRAADAHVATDVSGDTVPTLDAELAIEGRVVVGSIFAAIILLIAGVFVVLATRTYRIKQPSVLEATPIVREPRINHATFDSRINRTFEPQDEAWAAAREQWHSAIAAANTLADSGSTWTVPDDDVGYRHQGKL